MDQSPIDKPPRFKRRSSHVISPLVIKFEESNSDAPEAQKVTNFDLGDHENPNFNSNQYGFQNFHPYNIDNQQALGLPPPSPSAIAMYAPQGGAGAKSVKVIHHSNKHRRLVMP